MLFRQKEKIPMVGQNSFRNFYQREKNSSVQIHHNLSSLGSLKNTVSTQQVNPLSQDDEEALLKESTLNGSTWDCKHMDQFLQNSQYAGLVQTEDQKTLKRHLSEISGLKRYNNDSRIDYKTTPGMLLFKDTLNPLVVNNELKSKHNMIQLANRILNIKPKNYDQEFVNYQFTESKLVPPNEQRRLLQKSIQEQKKYQQWKLEVLRNNRTLKNVQRVYKNGIVNVDNPCNENSQLYADQNQQILKQQQDRQEKSLQRSQQIDCYTGANPSIEFYNNRQEQKSFPHLNFVMSSDWISKERQNKVYLENHDRLFGNNLREQKELSNSIRAQFLKSQDYRNKDFNIITNCHLN